MKKYHHRSLVTINRLTVTDMIFMRSIKGFASYAVGYILRISALGIVDDLLSHWVPADFVNYGIAKGCVSYTRHLWQTSNVSFRDAEIERDRMSTKPVAIETQWSETLVKQQTTYCESKWVHEQLSSKRYVVEFATTGARLHGCHVML